VGVDDETGAGKRGVTFKVVGDGHTLWESKEMRSGEAGAVVKVSLAGVNQLDLLTEDDKGDFTHADWADATVMMNRGLPYAVTIRSENPVILTPKSSPRPRINSAKAFGVRPGAPFLYTIAATGDRPMTFSAAGLPPGLQLDPQTGRITGSLKGKGEYTVTLSAKNKRGAATRKLKIVCGAQIGLAPAMGWNSWNCFAETVSAEKVKAAADTMVASGLVNHGWTYINIDACWPVNPALTNDPTMLGPQRDAGGNIVPNPRFQDMKGLTDYIHGKGLKAGIYSSPGPRDCTGGVGSYQHEEQDAASYGKWGFDYLKYDWCSYGEIDDGKTLAGLQKPYRVMRAALDKVNRDILFSFCQYGMGNVWEWGAEVGGNSWRIGGDIVDAWVDKDNDYQVSVSGIGFSKTQLAQYAGPGHFNDPDMLVVGKVGWGANLHPTRLTPNEQYTHISLWCLLTAPLLIGCDMTQLDDFTLSLLTNDEVLEVDQDPLGRQASRVAQEGQLEVWAKDLEDGSKAVGLFNRGYREASVTVKWSDLGLTGKHKVRDLWRQKDLGKFSGEFTAKVPRHGVVLVKIGK
jgi:alpha-galactosidase